MKITASNAMAGIALLGGVAHVMLYMNHLWNDFFWMTAIVAVIPPLLIRKRLKGKKLVLSIKRKKSKKAKDEFYIPSTISSMKGKTDGQCKNCGKMLEDNLLTYCSQNCSYESFLNNQSEISHDQKKFHVSA